MKSRSQKRMEAADRLERYAPRKPQSTLAVIAGILDDEIRREAIEAAHRHAEARLKEAARLRKLS
jgi:hypothetical protein